MQTVASHGDFINRELKLYNYVLLNESVRKITGIALEAYDESFMKHMSVKITDCEPPNYYRPESIYKCIEREEKVIYLLTHTKQWHSSIKHNLRDDLLRLYEGAIFRISK